MNREVKLLSHLPTYIQNYKEMELLQNALNPEVQSIQDETERLFNNQYVHTCDVNGIENFERLLNIKVDKAEDLEARKRRVLLRLNDNLPYTYKVLLYKLNVICDKSNYILTPFFNIYEMDLEVSLSQKGQVHELDHMLSTVLPANIKCNSFNSINYDIENVSSSMAFVTSNKVQVIGTEVLKECGSTFETYSSNYVSKNKMITIS